MSKRGFRWLDANRAILAGSIGVIALAILLLLPGSVEGAPRPPSSGDWEVTSAEDVIIRNEMLELRGDLDVMGTLLLDNSTLRVWSPPTGTRLVDVHSGGSLTLVNALVAAGDPSRPFWMSFRAGSVASSLDSTLSGVGTSFVDGYAGGGVHVATDARLVRTTFDRCYAGLVVDGAEVTAEGCVFIECFIGGCVANDGRLHVSTSQATRCTIGLLCEMSHMTVERSAFLRCSEGVDSYGGVSHVRNSTFSNCSRTGIGFYAARGSVEGCHLLGNMSEGVVVHTSSVSVTTSTFQGLRVDLLCLYSDVAVRNTRHQDTFDEALYMYRSTFNISQVSTRLSYWGLRCYNSTGVVSGLETVGAGYSLYLENSKGVVAEGVRTVGLAETQEHRSQRGLYATRSVFWMGNSSMTDVRSGMLLDATGGWVRDVSVTNCSHQGVVAMWGSDTSLENVTVTNASKGYHSTLFNNLILDGCSAVSCREEGFNFSASDGSTAVRCNASRCPVGMSLYQSRTRLLDCDCYMVGSPGGAFDLTHGLVCVQARPMIRGGTVTGGDYCMVLTASDAEVVGVTFLRPRYHCVDFLQGSTDELRDCYLRCQPNGTGVLSLQSSPYVRGNVIEGSTVGIALYGGGRPVVEGNQVLNASRDGVQVLNRTRAELRDNLVTGAAEHGLLVGFYGEVVSRNDVFEGSGSENVFVYGGSSAHLIGTRVALSRVGLHATDSPEVTLSFCEFRDNNRGVLADRSEGGHPGDWPNEVLVEGCFFVNHSSYCVGVIDGDLEVLDSTFLDNGAGVETWNCSVQLEDCTMVGCWAFGLDTHSGEALWRVRGLCRLYSTAVVGPVTIIVDGGTLEAVDSRIVLGTAGSLESRGGARLLLENVQWRAGGAPLTASDAVVELAGSRFEGVGAPPGGHAGDVGVSMLRCQVNVSGSSFCNSSGGLVLDQCEGEVTGCALSNLSSYGMLARNSTIALEDCEVRDVRPGSAMVVREAAVRAEGVELRSHGPAVLLLGGDVAIGNSSLSTTGNTSLEVGHGRLVLVNTTHDASGVSVSDEGRLEVWWYLSVKVVWCNASELVDVVLSVADAEGRQVAAGSPDRSGLVRGLDVMARRVAVGGDVDLGPHLVTAAIHDQQESTTVHLTSSRTVELRLVDERPPALRVVSPSEEETLSRNATMEVYGTVEDTGSGVDVVELLLDRRPWAAEPPVGGAFSFTVELEDGAHTIELVCRDHAGNLASASLSVVVETRPIELWVTTPEDSSRTMERSVTIRGIVSRAGVEVRVDSVPASVTNRTYELEVELAEGANDLVIEATDRFGHRTRTELAVMADWTAPALSLTTPPSVNTTDGWLLVSGSAEDARMVTVDHRPVVLANGTFAVHLPLSLGDTLVTVEAVDDIGNVAVQRISASRYEPQGEDDGGSITGEVVLFLLITPISLVSLWYVVEGRRVWGDAQ